MPRLLFEKTGKAIWVSHLDLMRLFQRAFKRAGLMLTHTHGFNPRPSVSIALPLSVGITSYCELLDFELDGDPVEMDEICTRLNAVLIDGLRVREAYDDGRKLKDLALLRSTLIFEYDCGIPQGAAEALRNLFDREILTVPKRTKNGMQDQDLIPLIKNIDIVIHDANILSVSVLAYCQNPTLNPMQIAVAVNHYLPEFAPDFSSCTRNEIYDIRESVFR